ncbi:hypothetical protein FKM82_029709 [Ascaphus truei]
MASIKGKGQSEGKRGSSARIISYRRFLQAQKTAGARLASVGAMLAGLAFFWKLPNRKDITKDFIVRRILIGWNRGEARRTDGREPVTLDRLEELIMAAKEVCFNAAQGKLFICCGFLLRLQGRRSSGSI